MLGNALRNRKAEREKGPLLAELKIRHNVACLEGGEKAGSHSVDFFYLEKSVYLRETQGTLIYVTPRESEDNPI